MEKLSDWQKMVLEKIRITDIPVYIAIQCNEHQVQFWCPYCKCYHYHGNCGGKDWEGHRSPHCNDLKKHPRGYYILSEKMTNLVN